MLITLSLAHDFCKLTSTKGYYLVNCFVAYFSSYSTDAKLAAIAKLEQLGENIVLEPLIEYLQKTEDIVIKREGLKFLSKYKNPRALAHIILSLNDKHKWARRDAEELLTDVKQSDIKISYSDYIFPLFYRTNHDIFVELTTQLIILYFLSLCDIESIFCKYGELIPFHSFKTELLSSNSKEEETTLVIKEIKKLKNTLYDSGSDVKDRGQALKELLKNNALSVTEIKEFLNDSNSSVKSQALKALVKNNVLSVTEIKEFLYDSNSFFKPQALRELIKNNVLSVTEIKEFLYDSNYDVRYQALRELMKNNVLSVTEIKEFLNDTNRMVKNQAIKGLAKLIQENILSFTEIAPFIHDSNTEIRMQAFISLSQKDKLSIFEIRQFFDDSNAEIRKEAFMLLAKKNALSDIEISNSLNDRDFRIRLNALKYLISNDIDSMIEQIIFLLGDRSLTIRMLANEYLISKGVECELPVIESENNNEQNLSKI